MIEYSIKIKALENLLKKNKKVKFKTSGLSMLPFISPGDSIEGISSRRLIPGDIVIFKSKFKDKQILVLHRCIIPLKNKFLPKGDNMGKCDGLISREDILCRVIKINDLDINTCKYRVSSFFKSIKILGKIAYNSFKKH